MNKRILELAKQAGFSSWELNPSRETMSDTPQKVDKLAELIVQECAKICGDVGTALFAEEHQSNHGTAATCKTAIEQHFGVNK
jgi:sugar phosphate isomerase/epimerase